MVPWSSAKSPGDLELPMSLPLKDPSVFRFLVALTEDQSWTIAAHILAAKFKMISIFMLLNLLITFSHYIPRDLLILHPLNP